MRPLLQLGECILQLALGLLYEAAGLLQVLQHAIVVRPGLSELPLQVFVLSDRLLQLARLEVLKLLPALLEHELELVALSALGLKGLLGLLELKLRLLQI